MCRDPTEQMMASAQADSNQAEQTEIHVFTPQGDSLGQPPSGKANLCKRRQLDPTCHASPPIIKLECAARPVQLPRHGCAACRISISQKIASPSSCSSRTSMLIMFCVPKLTFLSFFFTAFTRLSFRVLPNPHAYHVCHHDHPMPLTQ